jgi:hypothetical protein
LLKRKRNNKFTKIGEYYGYEKKEW